MGRLKVLERAAGLAPGDHGSWTYDDDAGFHRAVTEYFAEGRDRGEQLVYVGNGPEGALADHLRGLGQRERLLDSGQLRLHSVQDIFDGTTPSTPPPRPRSSGARRTRPWPTATPACACWATSPRWSRTPPPSPSSSTTRSAWTG